MPPRKKTETESTPSKRPPRKRGRPKTNPDNPPRKKAPKGTPHPSKPPKYDGPPVVVDDVDVTPRLQYETPSIDVAQHLAHIDQALGQRRVCTGPSLDDVDLKLVWRMTAIGCTLGEIAAVQDLTFAQLEHLRRKHFEIDQAVEKGREILKANLRRCMWRSAAGGAVAMQIFLAKNYLGMSDTPKEAKQDDEEYQRVVTDVIKHDGKTRYSVHVEFDGDHELKGGEHVRDEIEREKAKQRKTSEHTGGANQSD
jgi:hypothetical protein